MNTSAHAPHTVPKVGTVLAWHEALNGGEARRLVELSDPDVEVGGPRGTGYGAQFLREWVERANIYLDPGRIFQEADTVVVEQGAKWEPPGTGEPGPLASTNRARYGPTSRWATAKTRLSRR